MKEVNKENILKLIKMKQKYLQTKDKRLLTKINNYIDSVMNKDESLFHKLTSYDLSNEQLDILFMGGLK